MVLIKIVQFIVYRTWAKIAIADARYRKKHNRIRYWVIRLRGRIYVFNREDIKWYKKHGKFKEDLNFIKLDKVAIFDTH